MNTVSGISSSTGRDYAMDLAKNSALKRSLHRLGTAVENGNLPFARAALTSLIQANPEYNTAPRETAATPPNQTDQDFKALTEAISNNDARKAKGAWTFVKADLAKSGIASLSDGTAATAKLLAESKASVSQQILSATFAPSSTGAASGLALLGGGNETVGNSTKQTGLGGSLLSAWLTLKTSGNSTPPATPDRTGKKLDTAA